MKAKLLQDGPPRTYALIFDSGDEFVQSIEQFAHQEQLSAARFTAIGAFRDVVLGYFQMDKKEYKRIPIEEQVEVVSLVGDVALKGEEPAVHAHVVVAKSDGTAHGGHVLSAHVRPTLEVMLEESPVHLHKKIDEETGLALISV